MYLVSDQKPRHHMAVLLYFNRTCKLKHRRSNSGASRLQQSRLTVVYEISLVLSIPLRHYTSGLARSYYDSGLSPYVHFVSIYLTAFLLRLIVFSLCSQASMHSHCFVVRVLRCKQGSHHRRRPRLLQVWSHVQSRYSRTALSMTSRKS